MLLRTTAAIGCFTAFFGASLAQAQYYPPYYQAPSPYYRGGPPAEWDIDEMPVGSIPGDIDRPMPRGNAPDPYAGYRQPYGGAAPYPEVQRDPYALPPPGLAPSYQRPPGQAAVPVQPGQAAVPVQPDPGHGVPAMRPPAGIGSEQQMASLPPDIRPETGAGKELAARLRKQIVSYQTREPAGTIIIDTPNTYLYLVLGNGQALRYGVGVGREGFTWSGTQRIARMAEWPDWHPPTEMIERQPYLPRFMAGGPGNPLGARALYLGNTIYRIHGTNQPSTIGTFVSSGCIRLLNEDVEDLYGRVTVGTRVVVLPKSDATAAAPPPYQQR
jgi:lipoprotein-anchoring transpeptidase ErfK/SrfK